MTESALPGAHEFGSACGCSVQSVIAPSLPISEIPVAGTRQSAEFQRYAHEHQVLLRAYRRAVATGNSRIIKRALWRYLRSFAVRVHAAQQVIEDLGRTARRANADPFEVAQQIKWNRPIREPARLWFKPKSSGGFRPIYDFGVVRRAACKVIRPILENHLHRMPFQFDVGGRGLSRAIRTVKKHCSAGYYFAAELDIENHYGSFSAKKLYKALPVPKQVIDYVVTARHIPVVPTGDSPTLTASLTPAARRGIPQGSPIAPLIAQISTSQLSWQNAPTAVMANYADNFCVLGKSEDDVDSATDALGAAIAALPGGTFSTSKRGPVHLSDTFSFLGHSLNIVDGALQVSPTAGNDKRYHDTLLAYEQRIGELLHPTSIRHPRMRAEAYSNVSDMWVFAKSWIRAFSECTTLDGYLDAVRLSATEYLALFGINFEALNGYENPDAEWDQDLYES